MTRTALVLAIGLGVCATLALPRDAAAQPSSSDRADVIAALAARPTGTAERAAFYDAAARADLRGVEALEQRAATLSDREARTFALDGLLVRHAEIDARGAIAAAERLGTPQTTIAELYRAWLSTAPTAALEAIESLEDERALAIASPLVAAIGADELLLNRVLDVLPANAGDALRAASLQRLAASSPEEAFDRALEIFDSGARTGALHSVITGWPETDLQGALDRVDAVADAATRTTLRATVLQRLVRSDTAAAIRHLDGLPAAEQQTLGNYGLWQQIALVAPEQALERAATLPPSQRWQVESTALEALTESNLDLALERLAATPPSPRRQQLVQSVARRYAARDADAALAWARSLQPPEPNAVASVLTTIAASDPVRAFEIAASIPAPTEQLQAASGVVAMAVTNSSEPNVARAMLDRVLALPEAAQRSQVLQIALGAWAGRDPAGATEWLLANGEHAPPDAVAQIATQYAQTDPAGAAAYAERITGDARAAWLRGAAGPYAAADPRGASEWIDRFRGGPGYDDALFAVVVSSAQFDPAAAAQKVDAIGRDGLRRGAVGAIAQRWTAQDPLAAARWASEQGDPTTRQYAVTMVTQTWAAQDAAAARSWLLSQPIGAERDGGLVTLATATAMLGTFDESLLTAFSSDQARGRAVALAAGNMALRKPEEARRLAETHITDPLERERAYSMIAQMAAARAAPAMPAAPLGVAPYLGPALGAASQMTVPATRRQTNATIAESSRGATVIAVEPAARPYQAPLTAPRQR